MDTANAIPVPLINRKRGCLLAALVTLGLLRGAAAAGVAVVIATLFDAQGLEANSITLASGLAVLIGALTVADRHLAEQLGQHYARELRQHLFDHLLAAQPRALARRSRGAIILRFVSDLSGLRRWVSLGLGRLLPAVAMCIAALGLIIFQAPLLALVAAVAVVLTGLWIAILQPALLTAERTRRRDRGRLAAEANDRVHALPTVRGLRQHSRESRRLDRHMLRFVQSSLVRARVVGLLRGGIESISLLATVLLVVIGSSAMQRGTLQPADVVAGLTLIGLLLRPLADLGRVTEYWQAYRVSRRHVARLFALPAQALGRRRPDLGALTASNVHLPPALQGVNLKLEAGARVWLQGDNGAGKSTLLRVLAGLELPEKGHVLVGQQHAHDCRGVVHVAADQPLLRGQIGRNLRYGQPRASDDDVYAVLSALGVANVVRSTGGLRARVQGGDQDFSDGERAVMLLARALISKPRVLLIDEIDAHMDAAARLRLEAVLDDFDGTIVRVGHHTPSDGWQRIELHGGQILPAQTAAA